MANPRQPSGGAGGNNTIPGDIARGFGVNAGVGTGVGTGGMESPGGGNGPVTPPPIDPVDVELLQHTTLLKEASLVFLTVVPDKLRPFGGASQLAWSVNMPTTVIPGVHVEVHMVGPDFDQVIEPNGQVGVIGQTEMKFSIYVRTPRTAHFLGECILGLDFEQCLIEDVGPVQIQDALVQEIKKAFPADGTVVQRDEPTLAMGYNSLIVKLRLEMPVDHWFNPTIDVDMSFRCSSEVRTINTCRGDRCVPVEQGIIQLKSSTNRVSFSFGVATDVISRGCSVAVAKALEYQAEAFLDRFVGEVIADRIAESLQQTARELRQKLPPSARSWQLHDFMILEDVLKFRYCPPEPAAPPEDDDDDDGDIVIGPNRG